MNEQLVVSQNVQRMKKRMLNEQLNVRTTRDEEQSISHDHKLLLLKEIKISLESLMFDSQSFSARSSWQNFSGTMAIFARKILAILEDGIELAGDSVSLQGSPRSRNTTASSISQRFV